ncbi:hypothetical protein GCM10010256_38010 [Streptomyces coeruleorubidus]|nr:hypothetical protein GCM10010256_38010 [Streptomyces coeruleorubidus]
MTSSAQKAGAGRRFLQGPPVGLSPGVDPDDARIHRRRRTMARRYARDVGQLVARLEECGVDARLEIKRVPLTQAFWVQRDGERNETRRHRA